MTHYEDPDGERTTGLLSALARRLKALRRIVKLVLRGYLTGQPVREERPRQGGC